MKDDHYDLLPANSQLRKEYYESKGLIDTATQSLVRLPGAITMPDNNPKSAYGIKKPSFSLIPGTFMVLLAKVFGLGAKKYGPYNWRDNSVAATVYVDAAERHLRSWHDRQDNDDESGVSHLAHVAACVAILIDAQVNGNLIDDRPPAGKTAELIKEHTNND